jgi:hypothetical protein
MQALGLVGLLVVVAILIMLWANSTSQVAKTSKQVRPQVEQLAGVDPSGGRVTDTYSLDRVEENGRFRGLRVTQLAPNSPMRSFYGLQDGDLIIEVGASGAMMAARDNDAETLKSLVASAYQTKQPLVVERDGKPVTLEGNKSPGR